MKLPWLGPLRFCPVYEARVVVCSSWETSATSRLLR